MSRENLKKEKCIWIWRNPRQWIYLYFLKNIFLVISLRLINCSSTHYFCLLNGIEKHVRVEEAYDLFNSLLKFLIMAAVVKKYKANVSSVSPSSEQLKILKMKDLYWELKK